MPEEDSQFRREFRGEFGDCAVTGRDEPAAEEQVFRGIAAKNKFRTDQEFRAAVGSPAGSLEDQFCIAGMSPTIGLSWARAMRISEGRHQFRGTGGVDYFGNWSARHPRVPEVGDYSGLGVLLSFSGRLERSGQELQLGGGAIEARFSGLTRFATSPNSSPR